MIRRSIKNRLRHLLWCSDLEATRFTLALAAMFWAVLLAWSGDLFPSPDQIESGTGRLTYAIMAQVMPERAWALLWGVQGIIMFWSLMTGVRSKALMIFDAVLGVSLWMFCVLSAFIVYWPKADVITAFMIYRPPAAMAGELAAIAASWWVLIRYNCDATRYDRTNNK